MQLKIRAGGVGEGSLLKRSAKGDCEMLDLEFVVVDGPYVRAQVLGNFVLAGTTDGHAKSADINRGTLRAIIESARGIKPDDVSPQARQARTADLKDFEGLIFIAKIGVEKGKPKNDGSGENMAGQKYLGGGDHTRQAGLASGGTGHPPSTVVAGGSSSGSPPHRAHLHRAGLQSRRGRHEACPVAQDQAGAALAEDAWQRRATAAAIGAARQVIRSTAPSRRGTPIGRLGEVEWGWIVAAILFGWIATRAEQAASEQLDTELTIRTTGLDPDPWDAGAVVAILPELAEHCPASTGRSRSLTGHARP